jgi:hypothetical protein
MSFDSGFNLPPGVTSGMLPGNTAADERWEEAVAEATDRIVDICLANNDVCEHSMYTRANPENFAGCALCIVDLKRGKVVESSGDPSDCPYFQARVEEIDQEMAEGIWGL